MTMIPAPFALTESEMSKHIVGCAIEAHRTRGGPGLLEKVYEGALVWELEQRGLTVERQKVALPASGSCWRGTWSSTWRSARR